LRSRAGFWKKDGAAVRAIRIIQYNNLLFYFTYYNLLGESNGNLPLRICPGCSVPGPYRSPDWVLVPAKTGLRAEY